MNLGKEFDVLFLYRHDLFDFVCFAVFGVIFTSVNHCVSRVKNAVSLHNASSISSA